jgi:catechol 2,3-dioxygenase-like lactoylglutathione lyase family enzyme
MIGYVSLGTNDLDRALAFYDRVLAPIGGKRIQQMPDARGWTLYGAGRGKPMLAITRPIDGAAASAGNGTMVALYAPAREQVDSVHAEALALGAANEGEPGSRGPKSMNFYGAYFRDFDGNKLCVFHMPT